MKNLVIYLILMLFGLILTACGDSAVPQKTGRVIKAVIKPTALTANLNIAGIDLSMTIPAGVTPPLLPNGSTDSAATVEITSAAAAGQSLPGATFTPASATAPGQLAIYAVVVNGFKETDAITIHLNVAEGIFPEESDFRLLSFDAFDSNGAKITGLTPVLTTNIY